MRKKRAQASIHRVQSTKDVCRHSCGPNLCSLNIELGLSVNLNIDIERWIDGLSRARGPVMLSNADLRALKDPVLSTAGMGQRKPAVMVPKHPRNVHVGSTIEGNVTQPFGNVKEEGRMEDRAIKEPRFTSLKRPIRLRARSPTHSPAQLQNSPTHPHNGT